MNRRGRMNLELKNVVRIHSDSDCADSMRKEKGYKRRRLLKYEALPEYLKDNEFIRDHYRCEWPLKEIMLSIFAWHNETLNIWTHLLGSLIFVGLTVVTSMEKTKVEALLAAVVRPAVRSLWMSTMVNMTNSFDSFFRDSYLTYIPKPITLVNGIDESDVIPRWPWFVFLGGAMGCLVCSSLSHLFACHSRHFNLFFWRLDYAGISLMIVCSFFAPIYYAFSCHPYSRLFYLISISLLGILAIIIILVPALCSPHFRTFRASLFLAMGFLGVIPAVHAVLINWSHQQVFTALGYEIAMGIFYAVGAVFYITRVPERWKPGVFDITGHSHQIFHVFVILGALAHTFASLIIMDWHKHSLNCVGGH